METKTDDKLIWEWKPQKWWTSLIAFWLISVIGTGLITRNGGSTTMETSFVIGIMLLFLIYCMFTERSWYVPIRIIWFIGCWFLHAIFSLIIASSIYMYVRPEILDRTSTIFAAIPILIWAMWRSTYFVQFSKNSEIDSVV